MGGCIRDDEIGGTKGAAIDRTQRACAQRTLRHKATISDHRVLERHERVEHERALSGDPPRGRHVDVTRIADDHDIGSESGSARESDLGSSRSHERPHARRQLVAFRLPQACVAFHDLDARSPQARDHLRVAWVVALVGAEVEDAHVAVSAGRSRRTSRSARARPCAPRAGTLRARRGARARRTGSRRRAGGRRASGAGASRWRGPRASAR